MLNRIKSTLGLLKISPHMSPDEVEFFHSCLSGVSKYFEFGTGGSTIAAFDYFMKNKVDFEIHGVDSDPKWINTITKQCHHDRRINLYHSDIGPLEEWGWPVDKIPNHITWTDYPTSISRNAHSSDFDLVLIDGRFRVACLIQTLLTCPQTTRILIHDYAGRPEYHIIESWCDIIASRDQLSLFSIQNQLSTEDLIINFEQFWRDPR